MIYRAILYGPSFVDGTIPRSVPVKDAKGLISPDSQSRGFSLIIGEHGSGETSLIQLAVNEMSTPKGIAYLMVPDTVYMNNNPSNTETTTA
jgi:hypothetical protein